MTRADAWEPAGPTYSAEEMIAMRKQTEEEEQQVSVHSALLFIPGQKHVMGVPFMGLP